MTRPDPYDPQPKELTMEPQDTIRLDESTHITRHAGDPRPRITGDVTREVFGRAQTPHGISAAVYAMCLRGYLTSVHLTPVRVTVELVGPPHASADAMADLLDRLRHEADVARAWAEDLHAKALSDQGAVVTVKVTEGTVETAVAAGRRANTLAMEAALVEARADERTSDAEVPDRHECG